MNATAMRGQREITLPVAICEALDLHPGDQLDWHIQDGKLVGRKLGPEIVEVIGLEDVDPVTLLPKDGSWSNHSPESISAMVRAEREHQ